MTKLCSVCKNQIAYIHMEGEGSYCYKCHSIRLKDTFGVKNNTEFSYEVKVDEESGLSHNFCISRTVRDELVTLNAMELEKGYYLFEVDSDINDNGSMVIQKLFEKLIYGINHKQINKSVFGHNLAHKGYIRIIEDEENDWNTAFVVDGEKLSPYELMQCFTFANGFTIQYRVTENSTPLIGEDDYLLPVHITPETLLNELESAINIYSDNGYMDRKRVMMFNVFFLKYINKLKLLYSHHKNEANVTGEKMIEMLRKINNGSVILLEADIRLINRIIHNT